VTKADRDAAAMLAERLGVPDITGPRNQEKLAKHFARHRIVAQADLKAALEGLINATNPSLTHPRGLSVGEAEQEARDAIARTTGQQP
jgi:predicted outer membrane protein